MAYPPLETYISFQPLRIRSMVIDWLKWVACQLETWTKLVYWVKTVVGRILHDHLNTNQQYIVVVHNV